MGRELIERRHRAIPPVLLASKYGESASLVTFLLLTYLNFVFLVAQTQQEKQVLIISRVTNFPTKQLRHGKKLLAEKISSQ